MKSCNGIELEVGSKVLVLRTPIVHSHQFYEGTVVKLHKYQVEVEVTGRDGKYAQRDTTFTYKRDPLQVISL